MIYYSLVLIGLVDGEIYRKTLYFIVKNKETWFPVDFPINQSFLLILDDTGIDIKWICGWYQWILLGWYNMMLDYIVWHLDVELY